jgi:hypothetical protein
MMQSGYPKMFFYGIFQTVNCYMLFQFQPIRADQQTSLRCDCDCDGFAAVTLKMSVCYFLAVDTAGKKDDLDMIAVPLMYTYFVLCVFPGREKCKRYSRSLLLVKKYFHETIC